MPSLLLLSMLIAAIGISLVFIARVFRSYPVIALGMIFIVGGGVLCFTEDIRQPLMGILWMGFSLISILFAALWLYKNKRWAFWCSIGADIGLIVAALFQYKFTDKVNDLMSYTSGSKDSAWILEKYSFTDAQALEAQSEIMKQILIHIAVPFIVFIAVALIGHFLFNVIIPKAKHQSKDERKHRTNSDTLIGQRVTISKDKENGRSQRGFIGDVDWSIEPLYGYETFKVGDVVKVVTIKGVTLMCTRDGKDYRAEMRAKHKEEMAKQRIEDEKLRAKRRAIKASRELEAEKRRLLQEEERAKRAAELRRVKQEQEEAEAKQKAELQKVRDQRKAAEEARKLEKQKEELALKAKKKEEALAKKQAEKQEKAALKETKSEAVAVEKPAKEKKEKPAKEKAEKPKKEKKESKFLGYEKHRFDLIYYIASGVIFVICIVFILISVLKLMHDAIRVIQIIFLALVVAYLCLIFILETLRLREKKAGEPKEEPKEEPKAEEPKAEEVVVEEVKAEPKEKAEFIPFAVRMVNADDFVKEAYNELKSEVLSYGIKSRVSSTADTFRLHTKAYVKMVVAGKFLKLYLALNPADYKDTTYPFEDASRMGAHEDTPFVFKIKSGLSIRRAKVLIADAAKKDNLAQGEVVKHDHAADLKEEK